MAKAPEPIARATGAAKRGIEEGKRLGDKAMKTPVGRAVEQYVEGNGNVLAGGVAYYSLASIAAVVVLAVSVASLVVTGNEDYRQNLLDFIGEAIPGIFSTDGDTGLVDPEAIRPTAMTGLLGVIAFGVLVYTATRYLRGLRLGVRTMLGHAAGTTIPATLRDLIALVSLAIVALVAAGLQIVGGALASTIAGLIGDEGVSRWLVTSSAVLVGLLANSGFVAIVYLVLGRSRVKARLLLPTVATVAFAIAVLQQASGYFVQSASSNPVLAPFAAVIALLIFVDFTARVLLLGAAWLGAASAEHTDDGSEPVLPPSRRRVGITTARGTKRVRAPKKADG